MSGFRLHLKKKEGLVSLKIQTSPRSFIFVAPMKPDRTVP